MHLLTCWEPDTDIHIPFYVRGPGIEEKGVVDVITTHTDVSSTLLQIAGVTKQLDGAAIPLGSGSEHEQAEGEELPRRREHATIEYWGAVRTNIPSELMHLWNVG